MNKKKEKAEGENPSVFKYTIKFFTLFKLYFGKDSITIYSSKKPLKLYELIEEGAKIVGKTLKEKLIENESLKRGSMILINGRNVFHLKELETEVYPEDDIVFFPPGGGG